jgi:hypothetical protein
VRVFPANSIRVRLSAAIESGCRSAILETHSGLSRLTQMHALGFQVIGSSRPYPADTSPTATASCCSRDLTSSPSQGFARPRIAWAGPRTSSTKSAPHSCEQPPMRHIRGSTSVPRTASPRLPRWKRGPRSSPTILDVHHLDELRARAAAHCSRGSPLCPVGFRTLSRSRRNHSTRSTARKCSILLTPEEVVAGARPRVSVDATGRQAVRGGCDTVSGDASGVRYRIPPP